MKKYSRRLAAPEQPAPAGEPAARRPEETPAASAPWLRLCVDERVHPKRLARCYRDLRRVGFAGAWVEAGRNLPTHAPDESWFEGMRAMAEVAEETDGGLGWWVDLDTASCRMLDEATPLSWNARHLEALRLTPDMRCPYPAPLALYALEEDTEGRTTAARRLPSGDDAPAQSRLAPVARPDGPPRLNLFDPPAVRRFIDIYLNPYRQFMGNRLGQTLSRLAVRMPRHPITHKPWWDGLPETYREVTGRDFWDDLPGLFLDTPETGRVRESWRAMTRQTHRERCLDPLCAWCKQAGVRLWLVGDAGAAFEAADIPCVPIEDPSTDAMAIARAVSAARRRRSEAAVEWTVPADEPCPLDALKRVIDATAEQGITRWIVGPAHDSLRDDRKREAVMNLHYQQPFWDDFKAVNAYVETPPRRSALAAEVMVVDADTDEGARSIREAAQDAGLPIDPIPEDALVSGATVEGDAWVLGACRYRVACLPYRASWSARTRDVLLQGLEAGCAIVGVGGWPTRTDGIDDPAWFEGFASGRCRVLPNRRETLRRAFARLRAAGDRRMGGSSETWEDRDGFRRMLKKPWLIETTPDNTLPLRPETSTAEDAVRRYVFTCETGRFDRIALVMEHLHEGRLVLNGEPLHTDKAGWHWDTGFGSKDITDRVREGENRIERHCAPGGYGADEGVYLVGAFGVRLASPDRPVIVSPPRVLRAGSWTDQGFPFFAGPIALATDFTLPDAVARKGRAVLRLIDPACASCRVSVNGKDAGTIWSEPWTLAIGPYVRGGRNRLDLTVTGTLQPSLTPPRGRDGHTYSPSEAGLVGGVELITPKV